MPIYEYDCLKCGSVFEELVYSSTEKVKCGCGSPRVRKRVSLFGVAGTGKRVGSSGSCKSCSSRNCSSCS